MGIVYCALKLDTSPEPLIFPMELVSDRSLGLHRKSVVAGYGRHLEAGPFYGVTEHDAVCMLTGGALQNCDYKGN